MALPPSKTLLYRAYQIAASRPTHLFHIFGESPFLLSLRFISTASHHTFTTSYLINKCGLSQESALWASRYVNFENPRKPDSVLAFFRKIGLSERQISVLVRKSPALLVYDPQKTLLPKVDFLRSLGFSDAVVVKILYKFPCILSRSLKNHIIPAVDFLRNTLQSDARTITVLRRYIVIIYLGIDSYLLPNINTLRQNGVPESKIASFLTNYPKAYSSSPARFKEVVEEAKNMGFDPCNINFVLAVNVGLGLRKSALERKFHVLRKWGWSGEDCLEAFRRRPMFVMSSEDKMERVLDFFVNTMGYQSSSLVKRPHFLLSSFEKRIAPRGLVGKSLLSKGLVKKVPFHAFTMTEKLFLERFVFCFDKESSELLKLYEKTQMNPSR